MQYAIDGELSSAPASESRKRAWANYDAKRRNGGLSEAEKARKRRYYRRHRERLLEEDRERKR